MANEIMVLDTRQGQEAQLLFVYPVTPRTIGTTVVVPTPSAALPELARMAMPSTEYAAFDQGAAAFEVVRLKLPSSYTPAQLVAYVRVVYAAYLAAFTAGFAAQYGLTGTRVAAT
jgi:hypothetical protein